MRTYEMHHHQIDISKFRIKTREQGKSLLPNEKKYKEEIIIKTVGIRHRGKQY